MASLMIFKEKHADRYFAVKDDNDRNKVALKILKERYNEGYYYPTVEELDDRKEERLETVKKRYEKEIALTEEEVSNLPDSIKEEIVENREKFNKFVSSVEQEIAYEIKWTEYLNELLSVSEEEALKKIIKTPRGRKYRMAFKLLQERAFDGHQYEQFEEEILEDY